MHCFYCNSSSLLYSLVFSTMPTWYFIVFYLVYRRKKSTQRIFHLEDGKRMKNVFFFKMRRDRFNRCFVSFFFVDVAALVNAFRASSCFFKTIFLMYFTVSYSKRCTFFYSSLTTSSFPQCFYAKLRTLSRYL